MNMNKNSSNDLHIIFKRKVGVSYSSQRDEIVRICFISTRHNVQKEKKGFSIRSAGNENWLKEAKEKKTEKKDYENEKYIATQQSDNQNWFAQLEVLRLIRMIRVILLQSYVSFFPDIFWCLVFGLIIPQIYVAVFFFMGQIVHFLIFALPSAKSFLSKIQSYN